MIQVGDPAPDFALNDQNNEVFRLSDHRGDKAVLIVFYPLAFTGTCTGELARVQGDLQTFQNDALQTVTISVDSTYTHKVFSEREGFEFPLLADFWPHGATAQAYGAFDDERGIANRGTVLVDRDGIVRWAELHPPGVTRNPADWQAAIEAL